MGHRRGECPERKQGKSWWSELRDVADCDGEYKYILWNNREIKIGGIKRVL